VSEDATFWIAMWGAVTGTVATAGGIFALLRDRPRIAAHQEIEYQKAGENSYAKMILHVVNNGRQPVTVFQAGFSTHWETERRWLRRQKVARSRLAEARGPEFPLRLEPGEPITITLDLIRPNYAYMPDEPPQGFATDTRKKWTTAEPEIEQEHVRSSLAGRSLISTRPRALALSMQSATACRPKRNSSGDACWIY
jgi:hypothetical protein